MKFPIFILVALLITLHVCHAAVGKPISKDLAEEIVAAAAGEESDLVTQHNTKISSVEHVARAVGEKYDGKSADENHTMENDPEFDTLTSSVRSSWHYYFDSHDDCQKRKKCEYKKKCYDEDCKCKYDKYDCNCEKKKYDCKCKYKKYDCNCHKKPYDCKCYYKHYDCNCYSAAYKCNCHSQKYICGYTHGSHSYGHYYPTKVPTYCYKTHCDTCYHKKCGTCKKKYCDTCYHKKCDTCKKAYDCDTCYKNKCDTCKKKYDCKKCKKCKKVLGKCKYYKKCHY